MFSSKTISINEIICFGACSTLLHPLHTLLLQLHPHCFSKLGAIRWFISQFRKVARPKSANRAVLHPSPISLAGAGQDKKSNLDKCLRNTDIGGYRFWIPVIDWPFSPIEWTLILVAPLLGWSSPPQLPYLVLQLTVCSQLSYQFSAPHLDFFPGMCRPQEQRTTSPFSCLRWHATLSLLLLLTPASASANTNWLQLSKLQQEKREERESERMVSYSSKLLERPAKEMQQTPFNFHWGRRKKRKESKRNLCPSGLKSH